MAAPVSSSRPVVHENYVAEYQSFCKDFMDLIKQGKSSDADALLHSHKQVYSHTLMEMKRFDAEMELIVESRNIEKPMIKIVQLARILENQGLATDFTRVCQLGGLIALGNVEEASSFLTRNPTLKACARTHLSVYESLEAADGPRVTLMNQVLAFRPLEPVERSLVDLRQALAMTEKKV